ncbi:segregation and condensation protein B [Micromonospora echinospora]|uniref:Segregation and condensation protein B n=1 Tax=Micromonospora echinospora TaxID=1877 RepID=A0ABR6MCX7_MICEC|nr:segregation and condensation protein B [Micromonospora echinospora]
MELGTEASLEGRLRTKIPGGSSTADADERIEPSVDVDTDPAASADADPAAGTGIAPASGSGIAPAAVDIAPATDAGVAPATDTGIGPAAGSGAGAEADVSVYPPGAVDFVTSDPHRDDKIGAGHDIDAGHDDGGHDDDGRRDADNTAGRDVDAGRDAGAPAQEPGDRGSGGAASGVPPKRGRRRAAPEPPPAPVLDDAELRGALEAILLVVDQPVSELTLAEVLEQSPERVGAMLDEIAAGYAAAGHGFDLRRAAGGWRLYTRPEYATYVERFVLDGQSVRLTQAALETLAVVAYRQPVTRSRISAIRGVNCDGVLRTLVGRGLVEECGTEADSGAYLYRTTTMFLEKLGLNSVDDLPPLAPFLPDDVEELADATR